ncbi:MAG: hypothetical protein JNN11_00710 [Candidatus Doudnabacteria bacterium]|nr:hypothetical protein [Candidatus Doudnabacteria bacterium]
MKEIFSSEFLFQIDRVMLHDIDKALGFFGAGFLVLGLVFKLAALYAPTPVDAKYRNKFFSILFFTGIYETAWFGLRFQNITFFGSHFVAFLGLLVGVVCALVVLVKTFKTYKTEKQSWEAEQLKLKYLPK